MSNPTSTCILRKLWNSRRRISLNKLIVTETIMYGFRLIFFCRRDDRMKRPALFTLTCSSPRNSSQSFHQLGYEPRYLCIPAYLSGCKDPKVELSIRSCVLQKYLKSLVPAVREQAGISKPRRTMVTGDFLRRKLYNQESSEVLWLVRASRATLSLVFSPSSTAALSYAYRKKGKQIENLSPTTRVLRNRYRVKVVKKININKTFLFIPYMEISFLARRNHRTHETRQLSV